MRDDKGVTDLLDRCRSLFDAHRVEAFGGVFHVPDIVRYPALFAWDSGYHALAERHFDRALALDELETLYRANGLADGLLSHQRFVPGAEDAQAFIEELFGPMFDGDRTPFIDPPTSAYAAGRLSLSLGATADAVLDSALGQLRALATTRVVDGGVLPVCLHPFETGTEGSALMAPLVGAPGGASFARYKDLTASARSAEMSADRALAQGHGFVVYDPTMCGWFLLALEEVATACRARGRIDDETWAEETAEAAAHELVARSWWPEGRIFVAYDLAGRRQLTGVSAMGLVAAASRAMVRLGFSAQVASSHLHPGAPLWGPRGFAAGRVREGAGVGAFVQWEGNAVWGATAYWAHLLAVRLGRGDLAQVVRSQLESLVEKHGFREFYDAWTGEPGGAGSESGFTWPTLLLEMLDNERELAARSAARPP